MAGLAALVSCSSVGPQSIPRDRLDYASALGDSWKEQTLLNVVRLRYSDAPVFLDVSSVITSYTVEGQVDLRANLMARPLPDVQTIGAYGRYTDRPTISYTPLTGDKFAKSLLRPITPTAIFSMIQAGYPADFILQATTRAINGKYNRSTTNHAADPAFYELTRALRRIQLSEGLGMRIERKGQEDTTLLFFRARITPQLSSDIDTVARELGVEPDAKELNLTYGAVPRNKQEIALLTRSMLEILIELSSGIVVPPDHVASGRTGEGLGQHPPETGPGAPLAAIVSGRERPTNAYAMVRYRDTWYWIADTDVRSKRAFTFLMMFSSLAEAGSAGVAPVITVGVN